MLVVILIPIKCLKICYEMGDDLTHTGDSRIWQMFELEHIA